ncbi:uncharacterized protein LOC114522150 [Dendronephthya gigantea]|uniref:uncharacterized protein LOC114522150 n=1 Tax=Dendronephthya gigantea TaxID=151771 RepID=UPI001068ED2D|nr:uncharacterized protein LOC114522150 [Dendronephthya gigantea]
MFLATDSVDGTQSLRIINLEDLQSILLHGAEKKQNNVALGNQFWHLEIPDDKEITVALLKKKYEVLQNENKYLRNMLQRNVPHEMAEFNNPFNCSVSCGLSCVLFVFFKMEFQVCTRKFINMFPRVRCCSLALKHFFQIRLLVAGPKETSFCRSITEDCSLDRALKEVVSKCMQEESHPALLVIKYRQQNGSTRAGHCVVIMPDGEFIDVQKKKYWKPTKSEKHSIGLICVVKFNMGVAQQWVKKCGLDICEDECYYGSNADFPGYTDDLD